MVAMVVGMEEEEMEATEEVAMAEVVTVVVRVEVMEVVRGVVMAEVVTEIPMEEGEAPHCQVFYHLLVLG